MNDLMNVVITEKFDTTSCEFYKDSYDEIWLTREQIGKALGYANPSKAIQKIHLDHKDRMDKFSIQIKEQTHNTLNTRNNAGSESGVVVEMAQPSRSQNGKLQSTVTYYSQRGIMEICRWSEMPKANDFMDWVWDVIEAYRNKELVSMKNALEVINKQISELTLTSQKVFGQIEDIKEQVKLIDKRSIETAALAQSIESGEIFARSHEEEWITEQEERLKKLAAQYPMWDYKTCLTRVIEHMEDSGALDYSFQEYCNTYKNGHPGCKVYRLTVLSSYDDLREAFEDALHEMMVSCNLETPDDQNYFYKMHFNEVGVGNKNRELTNEQLERMQEEMDLLYGNT